MTPASPASFCSMLSGCDRSGDVARAEEWTRIIGDDGHRAHWAGDRVVLHTHCLVAYGSVLAAAGRWAGGGARSCSTALGPTASTASATASTSTCPPGAHAARTGPGGGGRGAARAVRGPDVACEPSARRAPAQAATPASPPPSRAAGCESSSATRCGVRPLLARLVEAELAARRRRRRRRAAGRLLPSSRRRGRQRGDRRAGRDLARAGVRAGRAATTAAPSSSFEAVRGAPLDRGDGRCCSAPRAPRWPRRWPRQGERAAAIGEARAAAAVFDRLGRQRRRATGPPRCSGASAPRRRGRGTAEDRARGVAQRTGDRGARAHPGGPHATPRSPSASTSRRRRPNTTWAGCCPSSACAPEPRPRPSPPLAAATPDAVNRGRSGDPPDVAAGRLDATVRERLRHGPRGEQETSDGDQDRRDRPRHLPPVDQDRRGRPAGRVHVQPVPDPRRRAVPVPHRDAPAVPARVRRGQPHRSGRRSALDLLRPRRGRRVRRR